MMFSSSGSDQIMRFGKNGSLYGISKYSFIDEYGQNETWEYWLMS